MKLLCSSGITGRVVLLLLTIAAAGIPAMAAADRQISPSGIAATWVLADFDGDLKPDLAELQYSSLDLRMSSGNQQRLPFLTGPGTEIVAVDVDGDNDLDIVVRNRFLAKHESVWLNDGKGSFTENSLYRNPLPIERASLNRLRFSVPALAIPIRHLKPLAVLTELGFLHPPAFGPELQRSFEPRAIQRLHGTSRLRAPPAIS